MNTETIYQSIGPDEELVVTIGWRGWNGIESDPKIIERRATITELAIGLGLLAKLIANGVVTESTLAGFADEAARPGNGVRPGQAGGCEASERSGAQVVPVGQGTVLGVDLQGVEVIAG